MAEAIRGAKFIGGVHDGEVRYEPTVPETIYSPMNDGEIQVYEVTSEDPLVFTHTRTIRSDQGDAR